MVNNTKVLLKSNDNELFEVDRSVIRLFRTLENIFKDLEMDSDDAIPPDPIPLPDVNGAVLRKVIAWCQHHKDDPVVKGRERRTDDISSWDVEFLKVDQGTLFELILAANYLDVQGLLDVACKKVGTMVKGKSKEEICNMFNIKDDQI